jgi:transcriptional regulator with XRE-family HTH domain
MDDLRLGAAARAVRIRKGLRQQDVATRAKVSQPSVSRLEHGHSKSLTLQTIRAIAAVLEIRVDVIARWRGAELDRLLSARHSALHESVAVYLASCGGWEARPEVTFAVYGERAAIDLLCWHRERRALLVIELKTEIVDVNELVSTLDRKRRLARAVAREFGWHPATVSIWLILAGGRTNRRRLGAHRTMLANAFPDDRATAKRWLAVPTGTLAAMSIWQVASSPASVPCAARRRVVRARPNVA